MENQGKNIVIRDTAIMSKYGQKNFGEIKHKIDIIYFGKYEKCKNIASWLNKDKNLLLSNELEYYYRIAKMVKEDVEYEDYVKEFIVENKEIQKIFKDEGNHFLKLDEKYMYENDSFVTVKDQNGKLCVINLSKS